MHESEPRLAILLLVTKYHISEVYQLEPRDVETREGHVVDEMALRFGFGEGVAESMRSSWRGAQSS